MSGEKDKRSNSESQYGYLSALSIYNHYRLPDLSIDFAPAADKPFRHLIITGPNGSGKTTVLSRLAVGLIDVLYSKTIENQERAFGSYRIDVDWTIDIEKKTPAVEERRFVFGYLPARRGQNPFKKPSGSMPEQPSRQKSHTRASEGWVEFLSYLNVQARLAREDDPEAANAIERWLVRLESAVGELLELPDLRFVFDRKTYNVSLVENGGTPYDFNALADGHASIFEIVAEILLRSSLDNILNSIETLGDGAGIVLIDEIESHLHPALQEKIMPFLTTMFPNVQFVVTTHSSPVISSLDNAMVYDLASQEGISSEELQGIPYGDLMKVHFGISSDVDIKSTKALKRLSELYRKADRTDEENDELRSLSERLTQTSSALALEVWNRLEDERIQAELKPTTKTDSLPTETSQE